MTNKAVVQGKALPWSVDSYSRLPPEDLAPSPEPTDAQRVRVAAALATMIRDARMLGKDPGGPNAETIRSVLLMDAGAWARDIGALAGRVTAYDPVDPLIRFEQIKAAYR